MGLFDVIKKGLNIISSLNPISGNPLKAERQIIETVTGTNIKPSKAETTYTIVQGGVAGGIIGGLVSGGLGVAKGISIGTGAGFAQSVLDASPKIANKVSTTLASFPGVSAEVSSDLSSFANNPTPETALNFVKKHPYFDIAIVGLSIYLGSKAFALLNTAYNSYAARQNTKAELENTKAMLDQRNSDNSTYSTNTNADNATPTYITINNIPPVTPTASAPTGEQVKETTKKPVKKKAKKKTTKKKAPKKKTTKKKSKKKTIKRGKS